MQGGEEAVLSSDLYCCFCSLFVSLSVLLLAALPPSVLLRMAMVVVMHFLSFGPSGHAPFLGVGAL